ncbi:MAG: hypothetical protein KBC17_03850 [Candidatus Pacebacteria bacterium]|nr:hypothetical protein [Candidatus Paceibacterota bacterium]
MKKALFWAIIIVLATCSTITFFLAEKSARYWLYGGVIILLTWLTKVVSDHQRNLEKERLWHRVIEWYKSAESRMRSSYTTPPLSPDNIGRILHLEGKLFPTIDAENNHTYIIKLGGGYSVKFTLKPKYVSESNMSTYRKQFAETYISGWSLKNINLFHDRRRILVT